MLIRSLMLILLLDTGQGQDKTCGTIPEGCSCLRPNHLKCYGNRESLDPILESLNHCNVTILELSLTGLDTLRAGTFSRQTLSVLVISSSNLRNLQSGALDPLKTNLTALSLPDNKFNSIPGEVFHLPNLNRLDLSQNLIERIDDAPWGQNSVLEYLNLSDNEIADINRVVVPVNLKTLKLNHNILSWSGLSQFSMSHIRDMDLSHNQLNETLSQHLLPVSNVLRTLDLSFNNLVKLDQKALFGLPRLRNLNLKGNSIELIKPEAFKGLTRLRNLDLSNNDILELPVTVFRFLSNLETLDLSQNHLQVISAGLTTSLHNLHSFTLSSNDIYRIDPLKDVKHNLASLRLDSNALECGCSMRPFQGWLQETVNLSPESKKSIKCSTPTKYANAILNNLNELSCDNDASNEDVIPFKSIPEEFNLMSKTISNDEVNLKWMVKVSNFTRDQFQLYKSDEHGGQIQFYSGPLLTHNMSELTTVLEANFNLRQVGILTHNIHPVANILACATIFKPDQTLVANCTGITLTDDFSMHPLTSIKGIEAEAEARGTIRVNYSLNAYPVNASCHINLQIEAGDFDDLGERVVASHILQCSKEGSFQFNGLRLDPESHLRICAWLDFGNHIYHTNSVCTDVIETEGSNLRLKAPSTPDGWHDPLHQRKAPILPLVLTLVFLGVGIATLVVLYLIVKGYLSDRHKADLFRMRFCNLNQQNNNNARAGSISSNSTTSQGSVHSPVLQTSGFMLGWLNRFFMWKRRHRYQFPVPDSDELMLREESTFDTSVV